MSILKKFNEFYYPEDDSVEKNPVDSNSYQITQDEMNQLQKLSKGETSEVNINGFTVTMPSEFDGQGFLVANSEGKHKKISFSGGYPEMAEAERKVLDIITGKAILESKRHRRHRK
jgi:hypothetical protein